MVSIIDAWQLIEDAPDYWMVSVLRFWRHGRIRYSVSIDLVDEDGHTIVEMALVTSDSLAAAITQAFAVTRGE